jgi:VWFA-related protein
VAAGVLALLALAAIGLSPAQQRFPTAAQLVTIDVVVVDAEGRPVRGLSRDEFEVQDAGEPQALSHFEAVSAPEETGTAPAGPVVAISTNLVAAARTTRSFVIVYDDLHLSPLRAPAARDAVDRFLEREVRAGERVALVATGSGGWWSAELPEGRDDLRAFLDGQSQGRSLQGQDAMTAREAQRIAEYDDTAVRESVVDRWVRQDRCEDICQYMRNCDPREGRRACSEQVRGEALQRHEQARHGLQRTLAAMASAMAGAAAERGRKSVVLVSEGFLFDPRDSAYREVVQASLRANAAIHFLDVRGLSSGSPTSDVSHRGDVDDSLAGASEESALAAAGAEQIAEDSGGFTLGRGVDLPVGLARLARESETYYLLGYEPAVRPGAPGLRSVTVRVTLPGLTVRARKGYFVDEAGRVAEPAVTRAPQAKPGARREPLLPSLVTRDEIGLRAAAYVGPAADKSRTKVRLVLEVDPHSLGAAQGDVPLEVRGDVWPRDGAQWVGLDRNVKVSAKGPEWRALTWDVALAPGVYQARLRLREPASAREGTLVHRFFVAEPKALRFATPIVTDQLQQSADGGAPSLRAGASRAYATGAGRSLYVQLEVLGARGAVAARVVLRDASGREVRAVPEAPVAPDPSGRLVRAIGFALDDVPPGRYALALEARDAKAAEPCRHEERLVLEAASRSR